MNVVVIGAGIGGLTAGALLLRAGHAVTVLEAHVYPGGCAGTFFHRGYRFDAGATLAGGFASGAPHARLAETLGLRWPVEPVEPAWVVHLPDRTLTQWTDAPRWRDERRHAFPGTERFWRTQEALAHAAWDLTSRPFPWPPQSTREWAVALTALRPGALPALRHMFASVADLAPGHDAAFKTFLDAQLLISAQTTADRANAMYGSAALDLPRRGVHHVRRGIGALAETLADWVTRHGGQILYRQRAMGIDVRNGRAARVRTEKGLALECDAVLANVTPWALADLLGGQAPSALRRETRRQQGTWGAFTLYLGLEAAALPPGIPDHHQVVVDAERAMGEGNSVFISVSPAGDASRAPSGRRAATLSTHTATGPWWRLRASDAQAYAARRARYAERLLAAGERAIPGLRASVRMCLPGTPVTFERFTRRPQGMVGGFPQTSLFAARGPRTGIRSLWLVGDSVFPGQSTAGVTLGGMRVAAAVLHEAPRPRLWPVPVPAQR